MLQRGVLRQADRAVLAATYATEFAHLTAPRIDAMFTIDPPPRSRIGSISARVK